MNKISLCFLFVLVQFFSCTLMATAEAQVARVVKSVKKKKKKKKDRSSYAEQPPSDKSLAVQVGQRCTIRKDGDVGGVRGNTIHLVVTTGTTLVSFTERPVRSAVTLGTEAFVLGFPYTFRTSSPNTAVTFSSGGDKQETLIVKFSKASLVATNENDSVVVDYTIQQDGSQGDNGMLMLLDLFDNDDAASVTLGGGCTLFIDSFSVADQYNSQTDYCFKCGTGSTGFANCWSKTDACRSYVSTQNPTCLNAVGTTGVASGQCGPPCFIYDNTKNYCYKCEPCQDLAPFGNDDYNCWSVGKFTDFSGQCQGTSGVGDNQCGVECGEYFEYYYDGSSDTAFC